MKYFYGWRMVSAASGIEFLIAAFLTRSFGLYIAVISNEMGWSKTSLSGAAALLAAVAAIIGPVLGWLIHRFGPQKIISIGIVFLSSGLILLSQVSLIVNFYLSAILLGIGSSLCGYFPLSVALIQWFEKFRSRALSIMSFGAALGGLMVPMMAWSMQHFGWRTTAAYSGILIFIFGLPLAAIIRGRPEDNGDHIDGKAPELSVESITQIHKEISIIQAEFSPAEAIRTGAFWMLAIGMGMAVLVGSAVNVHAITHMTEGLGLSLHTASWIIFTMTFGQMVGIVMGAWLGDMFEKRNVAALCMMTHALGLLCLTFATNIYVLIAFGVFHGVSWGLRGPFMQAIQADYFGRNSIALILGLSATIVSLAQVGGPMIAGVLADLTGNYQLGFCFLALLSALGSLCFFYAVKPLKPITNFDQNINKDDSAPRH